MLKNIDLTNKCGSCCHFKPIEDTATGECLQNPYNDSVVHDPKHPYWVVLRSRAKCRWYNAPPPTNADRIRAMSDEELATDLTDVFQEICEDGVPSKEWVLEWLKQPAEE